MEKLLNLPVEVMETLDHEGLILIKGGNNDKTPVNNQGSMCTGANNQGGQCTGINNQGEMCKGA